MADISLIPKDYKARTKIKLSFSKAEIFIGGLIILGLLFYGGLLVYNRSLDKQLEAIQIRIEKVDEQRDIEFEKETILLERSLKNLKEILKNHLYWSNLLSKIENLTLSQMSFSKFSGQLNENDSIDLTLKGKTPGYSLLAKQMVSFNENRSVSSLNVSRLGLGTEGGIEFELNINLLKNILLK